MIFIVLTYLPKGIRVYQFRFTSITEMFSYCSQYGYILKCYYVGREGGGKGGGGAEQPNTRHEWCVGVLFKG